MSDTHEKLARLLKTYGWTDQGDAQWHLLRNAIPKIREIVAEPAETEKALSETRIAAKLLGETVSKLQQLLDQAAKPTYTPPSSTAEEVMREMLDGARQIFSDEHGKFFDQAAEDVVEWLSAMISVREEMQNFDKGQEKLPRYASRVVRDGQEYLIDHWQLGTRIDGSKVLVDPVTRILYDTVTGKETPRRDDDCYMRIHG